MAKDGYSFVVHFTINAYPRVLEASVIEPARAAEQAHRIARAFGPRVVVWRYDPIIVTGATPLRSHAERFARLAGALAGAVDEVVLSFAGFYRKTRRNLAIAGESSGLTWSDPPVGDKRASIAELAGIAGDFGMKATICAQPELAVGGAGEARCIDARRLGDVAGTPVRGQAQGQPAGLRLPRSARHRRL